MPMVKVDGWALILKLLTDAYVRMSGWGRFFLIAYGCLRGGWVGGFGKILCLRNMWMTPKLAVTLSRLGGIVVFLR